jgi:DNA end-binding protein Ku
VAAPRALWKGYLKLGNITCAVKLTGAVTEAGKIHFRTLNRKNRTPVKAIYIDQETGEPVERDQQVKGYELDKGEYLLIEPAEIDKLKTAGEHRLEIDGFVDRSSVSSVYREKPYYLLPGDRLASEPYALIHSALRHQEMDAVGRIVMQQRERSVLIEPLDGGLVVTLLRQASEVVADKQFFEGIPKGKVDADLADIAGMLIDRKATHFDPSSFDDRYENALAEMIEAKRMGKKLPKAAAAKPREKVTNLASLLKRSLEQEDKHPARSRTRKAA